MLAANFHFTELRRKLKSFSDAKKVQNRVSSKSLEGLGLEISRTNFWWS